jgi:CRISPR/Cas system CMR-associated protein Cmr5 small subunit
MEKYILLNSEKQEIAQGSSLSQISDTIGCSRQHLYNQLKKNGSEATYGANKFYIINTEAEAWWKRTQEILSKMDEANIMMHNGML